MSLVAQLAEASAAVAELMAKVRPEQWAAPTPCADWTVARLVDHLIGMNRVFVAMLADEPIPRAERLQIRLYDLLAHGWDLARAIGQPLELPEAVAEESLAFVRTQLSDQSRPGRFDPPQPVADTAPALDRLAAFLGRTVGPSSGASSTGDSMVNLIDYCRELPHHSQHS